MKFRLLEKDIQGNKIGAHYVGNKVYVAGQIVESGTDLAARFRGKFERVSDDTPVSKPRIDDTIKPPIQRKITKKTLPGADGTVQGEGGNDDSIATPPSPPSSEEEEPAPKKKAVTTKYGLDVTDDYPDAIVLAMKVYSDKKTGSLLVLDPESDQVLKRAKNGNLIEKFLKSQLG